MGSIDQISETLGAMKSDIEHIKKSTEVIESISRQVISNENAIQSAHKRLDSIEPDVDSYRSLRNKGIGVVGAVAFIMGCLGSFISKIVSLFIN